MKGMRKVVRGADFEGVVRYVFSGDDEKRPTPGKLLGGSFGSDAKPGAIIKQFEGISAVKKGSIKKPVWHNSLRLPKGEEVSEERWLEIGDEYMARMNFTDGHPRIYVLHDDYEGQHIHIVASRVAADGSVFYGRNENLISTQVIAKLEKEFSLTITKGVELDDENRIVMPDVKPLRKKEIDKAVRTGQRPPRLVLQEAVETALAGRPTTEKFIEKLERVGIEVKASFKGEVFNGFSFDYEGVHFKASELGDKYKLSRLKKRLNYDETRDHPALAKRRNQRGDHADVAQRDGGQAADSSGRSGAGDPTDREGVRKASAGDRSDGRTDLRNRSTHESDRGEPSVDEAITTIRRLAKPAHVRWQAIYKDDKAHRRAKRDRELAEAEEEDYRKRAEWARQERIRQAREARPLRCLIINADPTGYRLWRAKQMVREYGSSSNLLTLFFITRNARRREIIYEYGGAKIVDKGPLILAKSGSLAEIEAMLELAKLKNWKRLKFRGTEEFKAEAMRLAILRGFEIGADPKDQALARKIEADVRAAQSPAPKTGPPFVAAVPQPPGVL